MTKKPSKPKKPITEKQREADEKLRAELQNFDLKKFDKLMEKAVRTTLPK